LPGDGAPSLQLQSALALRAVSVGGSVNAGGAPLAVMDIGAAQDLFGAAGRLSRIDLRLQPGTDRSAFIASLRLPAGVTAGEPGDAAERVSNLSRAYRVNLTVLALVALFVGAFLVFSVALAECVAAAHSPRSRCWACWASPPRERLRPGAGRMRCCWAPPAARWRHGARLRRWRWLALRLLGGRPRRRLLCPWHRACRCRWAGRAALRPCSARSACCQALVGGWWPARAAQRLPPAQTLKGLGASLQTGQHRAVPCC
jgi:putative ABC transport system permease protein